MYFFKKHKIGIICLVALSLMIAGVFFWNNVSNKQVAPKKQNETEKIIDVSDANNIPSVEAKLGNDIKITQGYLLNYTKRKSAVWYMSSAYVNKITKKDNYSIITLKSKNKKNTLRATIETSKANVKKGDQINFVGTINLGNGEIELAKISVDNIDYRNVTKVEFDDLVNNINLVKKNYFIINGYMVTENEKYKLYDSKSSYKKNKDSNNYFLISWKEEFLFTGNTNITVKCLLSDTYKLKECEMIK